MPKIKNSYTVSKKLEVVAWHHRNGNNVTKSAKQFGIDRKRVREWVSQENKLQQNNYGDQKKKRKLGAGRRPLSEEMDDSLFEFLQAERSNGRAVSNRLLGEQAVKLSIELGILNFRASAQFIKNWKRRFNISLRKGTSDGQKTPAQLAEAAAAFRSSVISQRMKEEYTLYNIGNMDQTMVRFDNPMKATNNVKGEHSIRIANTGCAKRGFTVSLCARASGHKMPAFCIFKEPSGRIPPRVAASLIIPDNVRVSASSNGWMTAVQFMEWTNRVWGPNTDDVRRLLILDQAPIHKTPAATAQLSAKDTDVILIPGGCTCFLQPADVSWNKPFKDSLRCSWSVFMQKGQKTKKGNLKRPSRQDMISWVGKAWDAVPAALIEKSFKLCGISNAVDGTENGLFNETLAAASTPRGDELFTEAVNLLCDSDSDESFDGFSSEGE